MAPIPDAHQPPTRQRLFLPRPLLSAAVVLVMVAGACGGDSQKQTSGDARVEGARVTDSAEDSQTEGTAKTDGTAKGVGKTAGGTTKPGAQAGSPSRGNAQSPTGERGGAQAGAGSGSQSGSQGQQEGVDFVVPKRSGNPPPPVRTAGVTTTWKASPAAYEGSCPATINFAGKITTNGATRVAYRFARSDGVSSSTYELTFDKADSKPVSTTWKVDTRGARTYSGWLGLEVLQPGPYQPNKAEFKITCKTPPPPPPPPPPPSGPDLYFPGAFDCFLTTNAGPNRDYDNLQINLAYRNKEAGDVLDFAVAGVDETGLSARANKLAVRDGEESWASLNFQIRDRSYYRTTHVFTITIDADRKIEERDESNNTIRIAVDLGPRPPDGSSAFPHRCQSK